MFRGRRRKYGFACFGAAFVMCLLYSMEFSGPSTLDGRYADERFPIGRQTPAVQQPEVLRQEAYVDAPSTNRRQKVLIVSHARTGSSFTSAVIRAHPQAFFVFEPLYPLNTVYRDIRKKTEKYDFHLWGDELQQDAIDWIQSFLNCRPTNVTAIHNKLFNGREHTSDMYRCVENKKLGGWEHLACYLDMVNLCLGRGVTVLKTIRFRLKWAEQLLEDNDDLKIIYLVRDPRATLHSQSRVFHGDWFDWYSDDVINVSRTFCSETHNDLEDFRSLKSAFPSNMKIIRYEDGTVDPQAYARDIYSFLDLEITPEIEKYVTSLTSKHKKTKPDEVERAFSLQRNDPIYESEKWRYNAGYKSTSVVDKHCASVYQLLGYRAVDSNEDLENLNATVVLKPGELFYLPE